MVYDVDYVRNFHNITEAITDDSIDMYIDYYTLLLKNKFGITDVDTPEFQDAVLAAIACKISQRNKSAIQEPNRESVGNAEKEMDSRSFASKDPSYCDLYKNALSELYKKTTNVRFFGSINRQGKIDKLGVYL